ncbi:hypothetical protein GCM10008107_24410 [Psychrosphaera saromensis]|uniref:Uncharacterized protein n=2 Tax=Psychrosphaera saromensis TaxID=716813 RepID=A0A2S7UWH9_9GAMM|nr:hypothetical protein BTO11_12170 [Psychrosphaera saromensis]GHB74168.1 hypothetical protein GCM10008107_24410 [Psychrosphaera saromensis]GLQ12554.1 hypothetical protein GCM10007917_00090 [Psychrosphaera saromensis]
MVTMASYKSFVCKIDDLLNELKSTNPAQESKSWYLVNHLSKLSYNCHSSTSAKEVNNSVKSLLRFAVDSLDWNSELSNKVNSLAEYHASLIKACE